MNEVLKTQLQKKLKEERDRLKAQLEGFAEEPDVDTDYRTKFPRFGDHTAEQDENADEVEKYTQILSIEHTLEAKLKAIDDALLRIKKGTYGICEKCEKKIPNERMKASPAATTCLNCG